MSTLECTNCNREGQVCDGCGGSSLTCPHPTPSLMDCCHCNGTGLTFGLAELTPEEIDKYCDGLKAQIKYLFEVNAALMFEQAQQEILLSAEKDAHTAALIGAKNVCDTLSKVIQAQRQVMQKTLDEKRP